MGHAAPVGEMVHGRLVKPYSQQAVDPKATGPGACDILVDGSALVSGYVGFGRSSEPRRPQALKPDGQHQRKR